MTLLTTSSVEAVPFFNHPHQHRGGAVGAHDVDLRRATVADIGDVAHQHRLAVDHLDRDFVQRRDRVRRRVHLHRVLLLADLGEARGDRQVLRGHRVGDLQRRHPERLERVQVEIDHHLARGAAEGGGQGRARHLGQALADAVLGVVVDLVEAVLGRGQRELDHRH
ncbi:hypothetical protein M2440_002839 [Methylorubrum extorquens]|nr:hypothetical protein [Methylorubrum extorquens]